MHTHAAQIVRAFIRDQLNSIHAARRGLWCAAVMSVMSGQWLSLSRLARGIMGAGNLKAALKRVDRLIGCARIGSEAHFIGAALVRQLCSRTQPVVIAVDWSAVAPGGKFVELRASLVHAGMGRGLTIYQRIYPGSKLCNANCESALLRTLREWMPAGSQVIIVTDAGFRRPWFAEIERLDWMWVGRIRSGVHISRDNAHWQDARGWFAKATGKAQRWCGCALTRRYRFTCDMVLVRRGVRAGKRYGRIGHGPTPKARREARASAREPWLLAHSPQLRGYRAEQIVAWYARRMQIEENFRDHKSAEFGMGLQFSQSRSAQRLLALSLIGTLAAFLLWHIGQLAEAEGVHRRFKVTTRKARELSVITLALLLCDMRCLPLTDFAIHVLYQRLGIRE
jgi:hypothetical protein